MTYGPPLWAETPAGRRLFAVMVTDHADRVIRPDRFMQARWDERSPNVYTPLIVQQYVEYTLGIACKVTPWK